MGINEGDNFEISGQPERDFTPESIYFNPHEAIQFFTTNPQYLCRFTVFQNIIMKNHYLYCKECKDDCDFLGKQNPLIN